MERRNDLNDPRVSVMNINGSAFLTLDGDGSPRTYLMEGDETATRTLRRVREEYSVQIMRLQKWNENITAVLTAPDRKSTNE